MQVLMKGFFLFPLTGKIYYVTNKTYVFFLHWNGSGGAMTDIQEQNIDIKKYRS